MLATFFTQADNFAGWPTPIAGANTAMRITGLSTADAFAWETPGGGYGDFIVMTTNDPVDVEYGPEMVKLLLRLKARGPVAKFKNGDAMLERLFPSKG